MEQLFVRPYGNASPCGLPLWSPLVVSPFGLPGLRVVNRILNSQRGLRRPMIGYLFVVPLWWYPLVVTRAGGG